MQEDKYSLKAQEVELTRYAKSQDWEIYDLFKDVDSGTKLKKDGLEALLDAVEEGKVDIVLCIEQDRLSRLDTTKWEYLKSVLRDNNVKIAEPGHITDLSNADDEFFSDLKNLLAQRSRKDILRKMIRGKRQKTREGKVWGRQPDEYIYDKETNSAILNEEFSWVIPLIDELYLEKGYGTTRIAKELNKLCRTSGGKLWKGTRVREKLLCKAYHGVLEKKFKNEVITIPDVYPKLRTEETYQRILRKLKENYTRRPTTPHFIRDVKIRCSSCGHRMQVKKTYSTGLKEHQRYLVFQLKHFGDGIVEVCKHERKLINLNRLKRPILKAIRGILASEDSAKEFTDFNFDKSELIKLKTEVQHLNKQKNSIREQIDRLLPLYLSGKWSHDQLDAEKDKLDQQLKQIEESLDEVSRKYELVQQNELTYETIVEFLSVANEFDSLLEVTEQQRLLGEMFPTATLDIPNNLLTLHARLPQNVTLDIKVNIASTKEVAEENLHERSKERYEEVQNYLDAHPGTGLRALARATGHGITTLMEDQERFGPFKNLAVNKLNPEFRAKRIEMIKVELNKDPTLTFEKIAERTGINRKMVSKLIKENNLRSKC